MIEDILKDAQVRMKKSLLLLDQTFERVRTGRARVNLLDGIVVDYYGNQVPINQVATIKVDDIHTLSVTPWEKVMLPVLEKAIVSSNLGVNPIVTGNLLRIPLPALTEERRRELVKIVRQEAENCRVSVRNIRRDANNMAKSLLKDKEISEDEERGLQNRVQVLTDEHIKQVDAAFDNKEKDLMEL